MKINSINFASMLFLAFLLFHYRTYQFYWLISNGFPVLQSKTTLDLKRENDPGLHENESESDCLSDRSAAEEEQKVRYSSLNLKIFSPKLNSNWFRNSSLGRKRFTFPIALQTVVMYASNVTSRNGVGALMKTLAKIFPGHLRRISSHNVTPL